MILEKMENQTTTGDADYIAEEIMCDPSLTMRRKCISVNGVVNNKMASLETPLDLYKVSPQIYVDFLTRKLR